MVLLGRRHTGEHIGHHHAIGGIGRNVEILRRTPSYRWWRQRRVEVLRRVLTGEIDVGRVSAIGHLQGAAGAFLSLRLNWFDAEVLRCFAALPYFPHGCIGRLDVAAKAIRVKQRVA